LSSFSSGGNAEGDLERYLGLTRQRLLAPLEEAYRSTGNRGYPLRLSGLPGDVYLSVTLDSTISACLKSAGLLDEQRRVRALELMASKSEVVGGNLAWETGTEGINGWTTILVCYAYKKLGNEVDEGAVRWVTALQNRDGGFGYNPGEPSAALYTFYALKGLRDRFEPSVRQAAEAYVWAVGHDRTARWFERALALGALSAEERSSVNRDVVSEILGEFRKGVRSDPNWLINTEIYRSSTGHLVRGLRWAMLPVLLQLGAELTDEFATALELVSHWLRDEAWPPEYRSSYTERNLPESFTYAFALSTVAACTRRMSRTAAYSVSPKPSLPIVALKQVASHSRYAILTTREDEYRAVASRFDNRQIVVGGQNTYEYCALGSDQTPVGLLLARCVEQGPSAAQAVTSRLLHDRAPEWLLLVGIAGALPSEEICLGDVILASRLADYSIFAAIDNEVRETDLRGGPMHRDVENILSLVATLDNALPWSSKEAVGMERPIESEAAIGDSTRYYGNEQWQAQVRRSLVAGFGSQSRRATPISTARVMASSPTLVKDAALAHEWRRASRSTSAVEMELAGVYEAVRSHRSSTRLIAIRGISDIVGYRRDPIWTQYACQTAASYAVTLIKSGLLENLDSALRR
jgi:nucleoside phosphorylase